MKLGILAVLFLGTSTGLVAKCSKNDDCPENQKCGSIELGHQSINSCVPE